MEFEGAVLDRQLDFESITGTPEMVAFAGDVETAAHEYGHWLVGLAGVDFEAPEYLDRPEDKYSGRSEEFDFARHAILAERDIMQFGKVQPGTKRRMLDEVLSHSAEAMGQPFRTKFDLFYDPRGYILFEDGATMDYSLVKGELEAKKGHHAELKTKKGHQDGSGEATKSHHNRSFYDLGELGSVKQMMKGELRTNDGQVANTYVSFSAFDHEVAKKKAGKDKLDDLGYFVNEETALMRVYVARDGVVISEESISLDGSSEAAYRRMAAKRNVYIPDSVHGVDLLAYPITGRIDSDGTVSDEEIDEFVNELTDDYDDFLFEQTGEEHYRGRRLKDLTAGRMNSWEFVTDNADKQAPYIQFNEEVALGRVKGFDRNEQTWLFQSLDMMLSARDEKGRMLINKQSASLVGAAIRTPDILKDENILGEINKVMTQMVWSSLRTKLYKVEEQADAYEPRRTQVSEIAMSATDLSQRQSYYMMLDAGLDTFNSSSEVRQEVVRDIVESSLETKARGEAMSGCGKKLKIFDDDEEDSESKFNKSDWHGGEISKGMCILCRTKNRYVGACKICKSCVQALRRKESVEAIRKDAKKKTQQKKDISTNKDNDDSIIDKNEVQTGNEILDIQEAKQQNQQVNNDSSQDEADEDEEE